MLHTPDLASPNLHPHPWHVGSLVRAHTGPRQIGTIVRFSGVPDMWYVQWSDGTCRLCRGAFLEAVSTSLQPIVLSPAG